MDWIGYILSSTAGLIMVIGSLVLLAKGRIVLDHEGKRMSKFEISRVLKFSTQSPVLAMFGLGVVLLIYPVYQAKNVCPNPKVHSWKIPEIVTIKGRVQTVKPADLYAAVGDQKGASDNISLRVPYVGDRSYTVFADAYGGLIPLTTINLPNTPPPHDNEYSLAEVLKILPPPTLTSSVDTSQPTRTVSAEQMANFKKPEGTATP